MLEEHTATVPQTFILEQNYPNPFNSNTVLRFALPTSGGMELVVYNLTGQKVATLEEGGSKDASAHFRLCHPGNSTTADFSQAVR